MRLYYWVEEVRWCVVGGCCRHSSSSMVLQGAAACTAAARPGHQMLVLAPRAPWTVVGGAVATEGYCNTLIARLCNTNKL